MSMMNVADGTMDHGEQKYALLTGDEEEKRVCIWQVWQERMKERTANVWG